MSDNSFRSEDISFESVGRQRKTSKQPAQRRATMKDDSEEQLQGENNKNEQKEQQASSIFTGLVMSSGKTNYPVVQAFLMQGEFTVFITMDADQKLYIEPFSLVEELEPICEAKELCDSSLFESLKIVVDPNRQIITVFLFNKLPTVRYNSDNCDHSLAGYFIDFRAFSPDANQQDIYIRDIDPSAMVNQLGVKEIKQLWIFYNNVTPYTHDIELLLLVDSFDSQKTEKDQFFELFGGLNVNHNDDYKSTIYLYHKELKQPLQQREAALISIIKMQKTVNLVIFEDGFVSLLKNDGNEGVVSSQQLKLPFGKVNQAILEEVTGTLILQTQEQERSFFKYNRKQWTGFADQSRNKFKFLQLFGKFVIAQNQDKFTYLIELTPEKEIMLQFRLGEDDTWDFTFDADEKFSQFLLQYQQNGRLFFWWKYDRQNQFHLSKEKTIEQICSGTIIRVSKEKATIEIKQDMSRFEDPFNDFQTMEFPGLPIIVSSFTPYLIPGKAGLIFLCITPDTAPQTKPMYFVLVDIQNSKAYQCNVNQIAELNLNLMGVFFFNQTRFIGQRNISPIQLEFCEYEIIIEDGVEMVRNDHLFCMTGVGISAVCFDSKKHSLIMMRQQLLSDKDEFFVYSLNLQKYLNPSITRKPVYINIPILDVLEIVAKLDVFTTPISVFTRQDKLWASGTFDKKEQKFYAIVSNHALTLVYNVNMINEKKQNMKVRFSQIVTIASATSLMQPNSIQLLVISNTQACVFKIVKDECKDLDYLFEESSKAKQCKRLVGKNIDLKVEFKSKIRGVTCCDNIITLIFGSRSAMLELDEQIQQELRNDEGELEFFYQKCINSLNDLARNFKQILWHYYNTDGYMKITEDDGNWDCRESFLPITLMNADFVTLIQDDDGNQGSDESSLIRYLYLNNYNIWESIFRDAMATDKMEITYQQLGRFLTPVITNHNNNLLFNICYNQDAKLENILSMPGFEDYFKTEKKMFPIYFNFFGQSQIQLALKAHDNKSFYKLLDLLIKMQSGVESSYLVNSWLLGAFFDGLDIVALLNSSTLQVVCDASIIEHFSTWPSFHTETEQQSENYEKTLTEMMHDETAYFGLFGHKFVEQEQAVQHLLSQKLHAVSKDASRDGLYPIKYYAEKLACGAKNSEEQLQAVFELLNILSDTEQMNYFRCGYIQRLIEFQWNGPLIKYYNLVSGCYIFSFILIAVASILLHWMELKPMKSSLARISLLGINLLVLCLSLCTFEMKSFLIDKLGYFQSFWNWNDILLFVFSALALFQEIKALVKGKIQELELDAIETLLQEKANADSEEMLRFLKKKKKGGGEEGEAEDSGVADFDPYDYYTSEPWQQWLRVCYCFMCLHVSLKVLNVAQFNENIAFLVKILSKVFHDLLPFFLLWFAIQFMFAMTINALDVIFWNADSLHQSGDYFGFGGMFGAIFVYVFRMSIGDFQPDVYKFLPKPQLIVMWIFFVCLVMISVMVFCNMVVALINEVYQETIENRKEEALQKRCGIICELEQIFGKMTPARQTNIIVTRVSLDNNEREDVDASATVKVVQQILGRERLQFKEKILATRKDLVAQCEKNISRFEGAKVLLNEIQDLIKQQQEQGKQFGSITVKTGEQTEQLQQPERRQLDKHKTPTMTELDILLANEHEFKSELESDYY